MAPKGVLVIQVGERAMVGWNPGRVREDDARMSAAPLAPMPDGDPLVPHVAAPLARKRAIAIIGASADRAKFGNKAVRAYAAEGWEIWPVNPKGGEIEGWQVYTLVDRLPGLPDRASLYLKEQAALSALDALAVLEHQYGRAIFDVYLNPGVGRKTVREHADALGLNRVSRCSIRAIGRVPKEFPAE
ncbi:MAG: CoA-binding protein [Coriobacteriia bacterium]|nr:CoA-binding protein [Coriobacteriia bacterium]